MPWKIQNTCTFILVILRKYSLRLADMRKFPIEVSHIFELAVILKDFVMFDINDLIPKYTEVELDKFSNESEFMDACVELHKDTIAILWILVEAEYCENEKIPKEITKEQAVIAGNIIRLIKLNTSFLQNTCENKLEICYILNRCLAETGINLIYLLQNREPNVSRNYIKNSLITEKELWNTIIENIKNREGKIQPIEERMQKSIQRSFDESDFEIDEVSRSSKWKSIAARAQAIDFDAIYDIVYGIASHSIHGNWQDILANNLTKTETGFKVKFDWNKLRPQIVDGAILINLEVAKSFAKVMTPKDDLLNLLKAKIEELYKYLLLITDKHEKYLLKKNNS